MVVEGTGTGGIGTAVAVDRTTRTTTAGNKGTNRSNNSNRKSRLLLLTLRKRPSWMLELSGLLLRPLKAVVASQA